MEQQSTSISPIPRPPRRSWTNAFKQKICEEAAAVGNVKRTAAKYDIAPYQIRYWRKHKEEIDAKVAVKKTSRTLNTGRPVRDPEVERGVYEWMVEQQALGNEVLTKDILAKALSINPNFRENKQQRMLSWAYRFYKKHNFTKRRHAAPARARSDSIDSGASSWSA
jgi:transposase-like protein